MAEGKEPITEHDESLMTREITASSVASGLAGIFLEKNVLKGRSIEIPSLGIVLTKDRLRNPSKTD